MEPLWSGALVRSGRLVDLAYSSLVHQLGLTHRFFPNGFGNLEVIDFHEDVRQFQRWPPTHLADLAAQPGGGIPWRRVVADSYAGHPYKVYKASFPTPCQGQVYDALPPESRRAAAMLIAPDRPAPGAPCVLHLAATGDHGYERRTHLGLPLVQQGIATLALESPYYGERKPPHQRGAKLLHVADLLLLGRATIEESLLLLHWLGEQGGHEQLGVSGLSMGGVHASMVASLYPGPLALTPLLAPRSAAGAYCSGALYHATAWSQIVADLQQREGRVLEVLAAAGRGAADLGVARARGWSPPAAAAAEVLLGPQEQQRQLLKEELEQQRQQQQAEAEAEAGVQQQQAADDAAAATQEVQAAAHATAVQAACRPGSAELAGSGAGPAAAGSANSSDGASASSSSSGDAAGGSWLPQWRASGQWARCFSADLGAQLGVVRRLERQREHEAAVARLHEVLETFTDVTRFPRPRRSDAAVIVGARQDAYVSPQSILEMQRHLPGSEVRWVDGGHVTSFIMHHRTFRQAIVDSLAKLAQPPPPEQQQQQQPEAAAAVPEAAAEATA